MKSGFVSIIGRPNVGKSTLVNSIVGKKVAITSDKPQTTRNNIHGIYHEEDLEIVFVDTPGIHKPRHKLGNFLNKQAYYSISDVDVVLFLVDASTPIGPGDLYIIERLKEEKKPVILVINKIDAISKVEIITKINEYKDLYEFSDIVPVSALEKDNIKTLIKVITSYLTDTIKYYNDEDVTNKSQNFMIAEIVREKVFSLTNEEVPHSITCLVEGFTKNNNAFNINVAIIVDRDSLKKIVIGNKGSKIKEIGILARTELEEMLGHKVYLELFVKTVKDWRDKDRFLAEAGYSDFE